MVEVLTLPDRNAMDENAKMEFWSSIQTIIAQFATPSNVSMRTDYIYSIMIGNLPVHVYSSEKLIRRHKNRPWFLLIPTRNLQVTELCAALEAATIEAEQSVATAKQDAIEAARLAEEAKQAALEKVCDVYHLLFKYNLL